MFFETMERNEMTHRKRQERRPRWGLFIGRVTGEGPENKSEV